jgi:hypothetical protein
MYQLLISITYFKNCLQIYQLVYPPYTKCSKMIVVLWGAQIGKNSLPPLNDKVPHYTTPNITPSRWQVSNIISVIHCLLSIFKNSQESEIMPRVYPTKTSQNIIFELSNFKMTFRKRNS